MRSSQGVSAIAIVLAACSTPGGGAVDSLGTAREPIVGGTGSPADEDAVVLIADTGEAICTGVLIAPNLVLTALHCVVDHNERSECGGPLGRTAPPSALTISVGANASPRDYVARGARLFTPDNVSEICSNDVALISLDSDVTGVTPMTVRFSPPGASEAGTAIGYGADTGTRQQRAAVQVLAVGPTSTSYDTQAGATLTMNVYKDEVLTGESTCYGDSGGPLVDDRGSVFAIASRGYDDVCRDRPTFWSALSGHEPLIRDAATAAGHPLAEATSTSSRPGLAATDMTSAEATGSSPTGRSKKTATSTPTDAIPSAGCNQTKAPPSPLTALVAVILSIGLGRSRRRR